MLSVCELARRRHALSDRTAGVLGSLAGLDVLTLLTLLERTRKTGQLVLVRHDMTASLEFNEGAIVGVRSTPAGHSPAKILMIVAGWNEGTFDLASNVPPPRPSGGSPRLSVTRLLLAHAFMQDEVACRQAKPVARKRHREAANQAEPRTNESFPIRSP